MELTFGALDAVSTDKFDRPITIDVIVQIPSEHEVNPKCFDPSFKRLFEDLRLGDASCVGEFLHPLGEIHGHIHAYAPD